MSTTGAKAYPGGPALLLALLLAIPLVLLVAVASGTVPIALPEVLGSLLRTNTDTQASMIVTQIRLPRALLALLVGAMLGISGAAMQGLFRNPLADPSLVGVSAGASLGASLAIVSGGVALTGFMGLTLTSLGAFLGGLTAVMLVYGLATREGATSVTTMLLAGIAIAAIAGSAGSLLELGTSNENLRRISLWRMGGLDGADYQRVWLAALTAVGLCLALPRKAGALDALLLGESEARHLGVDVQGCKRQLVFWVALGVGVSVALSGTIAFVGLVIPHIVRMLIGPAHRYLLPASALAGALLLLIADTVGRLVLAPAELPVGIVTAALGAPFFLSLLRHRREYGL